MTYPYDALAMGDADFDALLDWLYERLGRQVSVSMQYAYGNVRLYAAHGLLARSQGSVTLLGPGGGGRVVAFDVGEGGVVLIEGELVEVDFDEAQHLTLDIGTVFLPARATAGFGNVDIDGVQQSAVQILFGDVGDS